MRELNWNGMCWEACAAKPAHIALEDVLGAIPLFLEAADQRPAWEQINDRYNSFAGGSWRPIAKFTFDEITGSIKYPGDPRMRPWAHTTLRDETIYVYQSGWVCIVQPDGTFAVSRLD